MHGDMIPRAINAVCGKFFSTSEREWNGIRLSFLLVFCGCDWEWEKRRLIEILNGRKWFKSVCAVLVCWKLTERFCCSYNWLMIMQELLFKRESNVSHCFVTSSIFNRFNLWRKKIEILQRKLHEKQENPLTELMIKLLTLVVVCIPLINATLFCLPTLFSLRTTCERLKRGKICARDADACT